MVVLAQSERIPASGAEDRLNFSSKSSVAMAFDRVSAHVAIEAANIEPAAFT